MLFSDAYRISPFGFIDLFHDGIAGINTGCTVDTLQLGTVADIYTGGAHTDTQPAVDTVAGRLFFTSSFSPGSPC